MSILDEYKKEERESQYIGDRIKKIYHRMLKDSEKELNDVFKGYDVEINNNVLRVQKKGLILKRKYSILILDNEMYVKDYSANTLYPQCLWIDKEDGDEVIIEKIKKSFSYAVRKILK